jgi:ABC-2 type transport system permease protein
MVRSSMHPVWILAGKIVAEVTRLLLQAFVVGLLGIALGARLRIDPLALLLALVALALFALAYASLSCWVALKTKAQESMAVFVHVVNVPLLFTSTALVPAGQMPTWLEALAWWNPLSLVANGLREALLLGQMPDAANLLPLLAIGAFLFALASRTIEKE